MDIMNVLRTTMNMSTSRIHIWVMLLCDDILFEKLFPNIKKNGMKN